ncbi:hypothetical protein BCR33DRAFT_734219 [Rhizoclosmatium globosum]|uniref:Trichohyalin-plectin-homology domain-containing protein n=1 Tax=Rhizoclosmatium globosum TaxID=329046 RepID=A0A1Y2CVV0_9FUNG|nr:hypothetical protein BCR33DRAFT_734219 [Rhizoclosmatium globosum]|eukprot:ORY51107.1 hypothetical protein BCR33DRAFT_734219 [Rhizoclosmatium globosum]
MSTAVKENPALPKLALPESFPRNVTTPPIPLYTQRRHHDNDVFQRPPYVVRMPEKEFVKARALALTTKTDVQVRVDQMKVEVMTHVYIPKRTTPLQIPKHGQVMGKHILGQRAKRLAFQAEKDRLAEAERNRIDAEWHVIQTQERKERVAKARLMQHMSQPQMRALKDQMNFSNILYEREMQIKHKKELDALLKAHEYDESEALRRDKEAEIREIVKAELSYRDRLRCADAQHEQSKREHLIKIQEREAEKAEQAIIDKRISEELAAERLAAQIRKREMVKATNISLKKNIEDRKIAQALIKEEDDDQQFVNDHFNHMQAKVVAIKKQRERQTNDLNSEREKKLDEFCYQRLHAGDGEFERAEAEKQRKRDARIAEIKEDRLLKIKERLAREKKEWEEGVLTKLENEDKKVQADNEYMQNYITKTSRCKEIQKWHIKQMKEKSELLAKQEKDRKDLENSLTKALLDENLKYDDYAKAAVQEFQAEGKNVVPILRGVLRKSLPFPPTSHFKNINTYRRLGFTVRYIPTEPKGMDPWQNRKSLAPVGQTLPLAPNRKHWDHATNALDKLESRTVNFKKADVRATVSKDYGQDF